MAVAIRTLTGQESLDTESLIINNNFNALAAEINKLELFLNPATAKIKGLDEIVIGTGTVPNRTRLTVYGDVLTHGNLVVNKTLTAKNAIISDSIDIQSGSIELTGIDSAITLEGNMSLGGEMVFTEVDDTYIPAHSVTYYTQGDNSLVRNVSGLVIGGELNPAGKSVLVLDFTNYNPTDQTANIKDVYLGTKNIKAGHVLHILVSPTTFENSYLTQFDTNGHNPFENTSENMTVIKIKNLDSKGFFSTATDDFSALVIGSTNAVMSVMFNGDHWILFGTDSCNPFADDFNY